MFPPFDVVTNIRACNVKIFLQYEYYGPTSDSDKKISKKKRRKEKDSDSEDAPLVQS